MSDLDDVLPGDYDPEEASKSDDSFGPVPPGWYDATVERASVEETRAGDGNYIKLAFVILGPQYEGRWVWCNLNIRNPNPTAQKIGLQQFGSLSVAVGYRRRVKDTSLLVGKSCQIKVKIGKDWNGEPQNEVKGFRQSASAPPPPGPGSTQQQTAPANMPEKPKGDRPPGW